jgi:hypothetical protein
MKDGCMSLGCCDRLVELHSDDVWLELTWLWKMGGTLLRW